MNLMRFRRVIQHNVFLNKKDKELPPNRSTERNGRIRKDRAIDWMSVSSQNSNVEILLLQGDNSRSGIFGRWLDHAGGALMNGISAFIKDTPERSPVLFLCEDTERKRLSMKKYVLTRHWNYQCQDLRHSSLQNCKK